MLESLTPEYRVSLLFYNPNIEPRTEYDKRKSELVKLLSKTSYIPQVEVLECKYDNAVFSNAVLSLHEEAEGGMRCSVCFELRLTETAARAKAEGFDIFTTTLSVSPHKDAALLNETGERLGQEYGVRYLHSDFKKNNGYKRSVELSGLFSLYRQDYCGCLYGNESAKSKKIGEINGCTN